MTSTAARRRMLRKLLAGSTVRSQSELVELLSARGHPVTQATVSRDLQAIGAVKDSADRYVLLGPDDAGAARQALARALDEFAETIVPSGNLVVIRTPPGAAQVVAAAVDNAALDGVLGTVAGDDTVLLIAAEPVTGWGIVHKLEEIGAGT